MSLGASRAADSKPREKEICAQARWREKPKEARLVFEAIVYVRRTDYQWKVLPRELFGSASAVHKRYL